MKIKLTVSMAGITWSARPGETIDIDDAEGKRLCAAGYATPVKSVIEKAATRSTKAK